MFVKTNVEYHAEVDKRKAELLAQGYVEPQRRYELEDSGDLTLELWNGWDDAEDNALPSVALMYDRHGIIFFKQTDTVFSEERNDND